MDLTIFFHADEKMIPKTCLWFSHTFPSHDPRNNDWPTSLGSGSKAYDTALVMQWLEAYTRTLEAFLNSTYISQSSPNVSFQVSKPLFFLDPKDCSNDTFVQALTYGIAAANLFFSTLRQYGVWVPEPDRSVVVDAGHQMLDLQFESNLLISMLHSISWIDLRMQRLKF